MSHVDVEHLTELAARWRRNADAGALDPKTADGMRFAAEELDATIAHHAQATSYRASDYDTGRLPKAVVPGRPEPVLVIARDAPAARIAAARLGLTPAQWQPVAHVDMLRGRSTAIVHLADGWSERPDLADVLLYLKVINAHRGGVEFYRCNAPHGWPTAA